MSNIINKAFEGALLLDIAVLELSKYTDALPPETAAKIMAATTVPTGIVWGANVIRKGFDFKGVYSDLMGLRKYI